MTPANEVTWSVVSHLSWIGGSFVGLPFLGPLVAYLVLKDRGPFVRHHSAQALNVQISLTIYAVVGAIAGVVLTAVTLGLALPVLLLVVIGVVVLALVLSIVAAIAAGRGDWYRYPLTIAFVS